MFSCYTFITLDRYIIQGGDTLAESELVKILSSFKDDINNRFDKVSNILNDYYVRLSAIEDTTISIYKETLDNVRK